MPDKKERKRFVKVLDVAFIVGGLAIVIIFTTVYLMPFRLDDVLHMDWAREHSFWDAFNVSRGEIVRSVRPVFAMTIWLLTHTAGAYHYFPWHLTLVGSFLIGLAYAGKTARYIAKQDSALYFTAGFFWLAFLPILNVLFWYGDLTFTLELFFVAPAWYYGLRGLFEGRMSFWILSIFCGILAVLAKEPALLLIHGVFAGAFIFCFDDVKKAWHGNSLIQKIAAALLYLLLLLVSVKLYVASPTRSNRFFSIGTLSHDQLMFFVNDRLRYYGETLLNPIARLLLGFPLVYWILRQFIRKNITLSKSFVVIIISAVLAFFTIKSLIILAAILILTPILNIIREKEKRIHSLVLLFAVSAVIILAVLLITVMLVKTQLTELSFVLLIIAGVYWALMGREIALLASPYLTKKSIRNSLAFISVLILACIFYAGLPVVKVKERLLRDVRDVRNNANDAIKWMGAHLPANSSVVVTAPSLYGLGFADEMTSKDDEYKLYAQYTFLQGYVRSYFLALNRTDISLGYLEDSVKLSQVLDSCRSQGNYYLFLQTGLDVDRFHSAIDGKMQLFKNDSLLMKLTKGSYPSEVWILRK
jgi:hypothetical protein